MNLPIVYFVLQRLLWFRDFGLVDLDDELYFSTLTQVAFSSFLTEFRLSV